jgi:hypothetical protein
VSIFSLSFSIVRPAAQRKRGRRAAVNLAKEREISSRRTRTSGTVKFKLTELISSEFHLEGQKDKVQWKKREF